jgi:hypothetical protein
MRRGGWFAGLFSLVGLLFLSGSCAPPLSELFIGAATDLSAPDLLDRVVLSARREGVEVVHQEWDLSGTPGRPYELPGSFNVYANDGSEPRVEVVLSGYRGEQEIVRRLAILSLVRGERKFLRMALVSRCRDMLDCPGGRTCVEGRCVPAEVDAKTLPTYQPGMEETMSCDSGTVLINTSTRQPMVMAGSGTCGTGERCEEGTCYREEPSCRDGVRNGDETDVDCGGSCAGCGGERQCGMDGDCASNSCTENVCAFGAFGLEPLAGSPGGFGSFDATGPAARFFGPSSLAYDGAGTLFIGELYNYTIRRVNVSTGQVTTLAGMADVNGSTDGTGAAARFSYLFGLAYDGAGTLFVGDSGNSTIRRVEVSTGQVTTLAGMAGALGSADGTGAAARFYEPGALAYDGAGALFIGDSGNNTIRRVDVTTGQVTTLAGMAGAFGSADGIGAAARFSRPYGLAYDGAGTLFIADGDNYTIRRVEVSTGQVTTLAGMAGALGSADGTGTAARFSRTYGLAYDGAGALFVADIFNNTIRRVEVSTGQVTTLVGMAGARGSTDGTGAAARFDELTGLAYTGTGTLLVADSANSTIRRVEVSTAQVTTLAGMASASGSTDGTGAAARFSFPPELAHDGAGTLFVADAGNNTIRQVEVSTGQVITLAGMAGARGSTDGTGAAARFDFPYGLAYDGAGALFVADSINHTIRRVEVSTGQVTTLAGMAGTSGSTDGTGVTARFDEPGGLAYDGAGILFVADRESHTIRRVEVSTGQVTTLAGMAGALGSTDGIGAAARFSLPGGLAYDGEGALFVGDSGNYTIRRVEVSTGQVTTLAGMAGAFGSTDGTGATARFDFPAGLSYDGTGNLFVTDSGSPGIRAGNGTVRRVEVATGRVVTILGQPGQRVLRFGPSSFARLNSPVGIAVLAPNLFAISDRAENTIVLARGQ